MGWLEHVRDLCPSWPQREQRCSLFLRDEAGELLGWPSPPGAGGPITSFLALLASIAAKQGVAKGVRSADAATTRREVRFRPRNATKSVTGKQSAAYVDTDGSIYSEDGIYIGQADAAAVACGLCGGKGEASASTPETDEKSDDAEGGGLETVELPNDDGSGVSRGRMPRGAARGRTEGTC